MPYVCPQCKAAFEESDELYAHFAQSAVCRTQAAVRVRAERCRFRGLNEAYERSLRRQAVAAAVAVHAVAVPAILLLMIYGR